MYQPSQVLHQESSVLFCYAFSLFLLAPLQFAWDVLFLLQVLVGSLR